MVLMLAIAFHPPGNAATMIYCMYMYIIPGCLYVSDHGDALYKTIYTDMSKVISQLCMTIARPLLIYL